LNGSYAILNPDILDLISDKAIYTTTQTGWVVQALETNSDEIFAIAAIVSCFDNP
jgi:hypothetical protein